MPFRPRSVEAALDAAGPADPETLVSFLVNALYLFGDQTVAAPGAPTQVTSELTRLGHGVRAAPIGEAARGAGNSPSLGNGGGLDRIFLPETFGRGSDHIVRLRALRKALRPGGLLAFHVIDRDRAWERTGERSVDPEEGRLRVRVAFDPADGRLTARAVGPAAAAAGGEKAWSPVPPGPAAGIQTWNLGELRSLVKAAGLAWERAYGDWDGGPPGTGRLIVVAARPIGRRRTGKARFRNAA